MRSAWVIVGIIAGLSVPAAVAQSAEAAEPPSDALLLVQSELASLEASGQRITIEFKDRTPAEVLRQLCKNVSLSISVERALPGEPRLTASFENATVKEILEWFAGETGVSYRVERGDRLSVFGRATDRPGGAGDAD